MRSLSSVTLTPPVVRFSAVSPAVALITQCQSDDLRQVFQGARGITTLTNEDDQAALVRAAKDSLARYQQTQWLRDARNMADVTDSSRFDRSVIPTLKVLGNVLGVMAQKNRPLAEALYGEISTDPYLATFYPKPQPMGDPVDPATVSRNKAREAEPRDNHPIERVFGAWHMLAQLLTGEWWRRRF